MTVSTVSTVPKPSSPISTLPTCPKDGTATRLTCGRCGTPICPTCLVRTEVGMRCPSCAPTPAAPFRRRAPLVASLVASLVGSLLLAAGIGLGGGPGEVEEEITSIEQPASSIGDELSVGGFAVTLTQFDCAVDDTVVSSGIATQRCVAQLRVRNDRLAAQDFTGSLQRVSDGFRRIGPSKLESPDMAPTPVDPGAVVDVDLVFRLPGTLQPSRVELRASAKQTPVRVSLRA